MTCEWLQSDRHIKVIVTRTRTKGGWLPSWHRENQNVGWVILSLVVRWLSCYHENCGVVNLLYQERSFEIKMELVSHMNALLERSANEGIANWELGSKRAGFKDMQYRVVLASKKTVVRFGLKKDRWLVWSWERPVFVDVSVDLEKILVMLSWEHRLMLWRCCRWDLYSRHHLMLLGS